MKLKLLFLPLLLTASTVFADMPKVGDVAPPFEGQDQDGKTVKLQIVRTLGMKWKMRLLIL